ncbi:MAG: DUF421 domain-containing protein [Acidobacteria bacterium]|nr:DUF421 domain-containing protein [Acidobacteriota bacterium]
MWKLAQPWWEFVLRGVLVYGFLLLLLRLSGKRQVGELAPFDLVLLLVLSNAVQNSMNAGDNSVAAGLILVVTLVALNGLLGWLTARSKKLEAVIEGTPEILIHNGVAQEGVLHRTRISRHELMSAIRQAGLTEIDQVRVAILENNGRINVIPRDHARKPEETPAKDSFPAP